MSETETHSGQFKIIATNTADTKKFIQEHLSEWWTINEYGEEFENDWDIYETEAFLEKYWRPRVPFEYEIIYVKDEKWLIKYIKHKEFDENEDIEELSINPDGTYDFLVQYYNGGTCLPEVIGNMIENKILK